MINDFAQLGQFPEVVSGTVHLLMVTRFYKLRDVRQHVCRFRKILLDPPKQLHDKSTKSDHPEVKTADFPQPKTATSKESNATTKKNKGKAAAKASSSKVTGKAAKKKMPKVIIHQSPAGPGSSSTPQLFTNFWISRVVHFTAVVMLSKEALKQQANRRKKKAANMKLDVQVVFW